MKKKILILGLCAVFLCGCGTKIPKLKNGQEAIVTLNGGRQISVDALYEEMKDNYALESLIKIVDKTILESKYKNSLAEANNHVETTIDSQIAYYNNNGYSFKNALEFAQASGFATEQGLRDQIYITYLQGLAIDDYAKAQITDKDIKEYYDDEIKGDIKISHILIVPAVTDDMSDEEKAQAETKAQKQINGIISELNKVKASEVTKKFAELAKEYSQDETTKANGGSLGYINVGTLGDTYKTLEDAAYNLKDGAYSTKLITTEYGYHLVLRVDTKAKATLDSIKDTIVEKLAEELKTTDQTISVRALQKLRKDNDFNIIDTELAKEYASYIQKQLTPTKE